MNLLLDTHIALWAILDDELLPQKARDLILNTANEIYYSSVSTWEVLLKHSSDPKNLYITVKQFIERCQYSGFISVNLSDKHISAVETLARSENAPEHKDPFDRLLLSQAKTENLFFVTHDKKFSDYNEDCVIIV